MLQRFKGLVKRVLYGKPQKAVSEYGWLGSYDSWAEAAQKCSGYDNGIILEKCKAALLKVRNGEAVYERDSVIFDSIQYSWPLLAALLKIALENKSELSVLDLGGSLGSSYFQNRVFLKPARQLSWNIVEQGKFVKAGKTFFENEELKFFYSIEEAVECNKPDVFLLSSSLQYLENPGAFIEKTIHGGYKYIIVDMMPFNFDPFDRISVQRVHPSIYDASYPCWLLNYESTLNRFRESYEVVSEHYNDNWVSIDGHEIRYRGFFLKNKML